MSVKQKLAYFFISSVVSVHKHIIFIFDPKYSHGSEQDDDDDHDHMKMNMHKETDVNTENPSTTESTTFTLNLSNMPEIDLKMTNTDKEYNIDDYFYEDTELKTKNIIETEISSTFVKVTPAVFDVKRKHGEVSGVDTDSEGKVFDYFC